MTNDEHLK